MIGIYQIFNSDNGKSYIGKSIDISRRWREHLQLAENALYKDDIFHYELGQNPEFFDFTILEICTEDILDEREAYWIQHFDSINDGYNRIQASVSHIFIPKTPKTQMDISSMLSVLCGQPLFREDKQKLAEYMGYRDKRGNLLGWTTVKKHLIKNGLKIVETKRKIGNKIRNCSIILFDYKY